MRLSRWWLTLFPAALGGRGAFEWDTGLERGDWRADSRRGWLTANSLNGGVLFLGELPIRGERVLGFFPESNRILLRLECGSKKVGERLIVAY